MLCALEFFIPSKLCYSSRRWFFFSI